MNGQFNRGRSKRPVRRPGVQSRQNASKSLARLHLQYELLESRQLLATDALSAASNEVRPEWFASFSDVPRVELLGPGEVSAASQFRASNAPGPVELEAEEWIVKLTAAATDTVVNLRDADALLDVPNVQFSVVSGLGIPGMLLVNARAVASSDIREALETNAQVASFSFNHRITSAAVPNDPEFLSGSMFGLNNVGQFGGLNDADVDAPEAWNVTTGSPRVVVGVIDSGIDAAHPDLYLNIWLNQGEIPHSRLNTFYGRDTVDIDNDQLITFYDLNAPANSVLVKDSNQSGYIDAYDLLGDPVWAQGQDDDGNGFIDDFFGVNFRSGANGEAFGRTSPTDILGHGTHVAGTIGAIGNNARGITGVNWRSSLMSLKFLDENNEGDIAAAIAAINYATMMRTDYSVNVRVLNNSWGQPDGFNRELESAIEQSEDAGILFVAAAGNGNLLGQGVNNDRTPFYPASYKLGNVVAVAASDNRDTLASFSNYGAESVDLAAPGVGIISTLPGHILDGVYIAGGYGTANGTSMATPHVSGAAALLWAKLPEATISEIRTALLSEGDLVARLQDQVASSKRLNVARAVQSNVFAPAASLVAASNVTVPGNQPNRFTVRYSHLNGIDAATVGNADGKNDLTIERLWGPKETFTPTFLSSQPDGNDILAVYELAPPGGAWDALDYGEYQISTIQGSVKTVGGQKSVESRPFGRFEVRIQGDGIFYVSNQLDEVGNGSLRDAIDQANSRGALPSTIILEAGRYRQSIAPSSTGSTFQPPSVLSGCVPTDVSQIWSGASSGDFDITGNITIVGDETESTFIDASGIERTFKVHSSGGLTLKRVTVTGGVPVAGQSGGGILSQGNLVLHQVLVTGNRAEASTHSVGGGGLAIWGGTAEIRQSTISDNRATVGGAIFACNSANVSIDQSTIDHNVNSRVNNGVVYAVSGATVNVVNTTVSTNTNGAFRSALGDNLIGETNGATHSFSTSSNGKRIAFGSIADNLVAGDESGRTDVFLYDAITEAITRLSVPHGLPGFGLPSGGNPTISPNGNFVVFEASNNLIIPGATGSIMLYDVNNALRIPIPFFGLAPQVSNDGRYIAFHSSFGLLPEDTNQLYDTYVYDRQQTQLHLVSKNSDGSQSEKDSYLLAQSGDGTTIVFQSAAALAVGAATTTGSVSNLYVASLTDSSLEFVAETIGETPSRISADNQLITFQTQAGLIASDTNSQIDVYVFDRSNDTFTRASVKPDGTQGNFISRAGVLSENGRYVSFLSSASNFFDGDTTDSPDLFVFDRDNSSLTHLPITNTSMFFLRAGFTKPIPFLPQITNSGQVIFLSDASFIIDQPILGRTALFTTDLQHGNVKNITPNWLGGKISLRNNTVAFNSGASILSGNVNVSGSLFAGNMSSFAGSSLIELGAGSTSLGYNVLGAPSAASISSDIIAINAHTTLSKLELNNGRVAHHSLLAGNPAIDTGNAADSPLVDQLGNLRSGDLGPDRGAIEERSGYISGRVFLDLNQNALRETNEPGLPNITLTVSSQNPINSLRKITSGPDDARTIGDNETGNFDSGKLPPGDYLVSSILPDQFSVISQPVIRIKNSTVSNNARLNYPHLTENRRFIAFDSFASTLVPGDSNRRPDGVGNEGTDVFVYDVVNGTFDPISVSPGGELVEGRLPSISGDGRFVVFQSSSNSLLGDANGAQHIYLFDRDTNEMIRITSSAETGSFSSAPRISSNGEAIVFASSSQSIVREDSIPFSDLFLYERSSRQLSIINRDSSGNQIEFLDITGSYSVSDRGNFAAFYSPQNLGLGGQGTFFLYRKDLISGEIQLVTAQSNPDPIAMSGDATFFAWLTPTNPSQIMLRNQLTGVEEMLTTTSDGQLGNGSSYGMSLSGDGRFLLFESAASNLVANDDNGVPDWFVYDRIADEISLVASAGGPPIANQVNFDSGSISKDGRSIAFETDAALIADDTEGLGDIYVMANPFLAGIKEVVVGVGETSNLEFALSPNPGSISGTVFEDAIANGVYDAGELKLSGWSVFLDANLNGLRDEGERSVTTSDGKYAFSSLPSFQEYSIGVIPLSGWAQVSTNESATLNRQVFLPAGGNVDLRDFAFRRIDTSGQSTNSKIEGTLRQDNGQGVVPMQGVTVFLDLDGDRVRDEYEIRDITRADGRYILEGIGAVSGDVVADLTLETKQTSPLGNQFTKVVEPLYAPNQNLGFSNPQAITIGDFNGDTFPDLAIALNEGNQVALRLNDGKGSFSSNTISVPLSGTGPVAIVSGKFNGNSKADLAVANYSSGTVSILLDFNGVNFANTSSISVGATPVDLALGDVDNDTDVDLVVANQGGSGTGPSFRPLFNSGNGTFTLGTTVPISATNATGIALGKFNDDARPDVVVISDGTFEASSGSVRVYQGFSDGSYSLLSTADVGVKPRDIIATNFDQDGFDDVAITNFSTNTLSVMRGTSGGSLLSIGQPLSTAKGALDLAVADMENDGDIDLLVGNLTDKNISIFRSRFAQKGSLSFEPSSNVGVAAIDFAQRMPIAISDIDKSGTQDIITVPSKSRTIHILQNSLVGGSHRVAVNGADTVVGLDFVTVPALLLPKLNEIANPSSIFEDDSIQAVSLTGITRGRNGSTPLRISAMSSNSALIGNPLTVNYSGVSQNGTLTYTTLNNASGSSVITVTLRDPGADTLIDTADDGVIDRSFTVTVSPVNDPPTFSLPASRSFGVDEDSGVQSISGFVTGITRGGGDFELSQSLFDFVVTPDNPSLFNVLPAIDRSGNLTFTPRPDAAGNASVTVTLKDDGGTANGGSDTRTDVFVLSINPVNDAPSINIGGNRSIAANAGPQSVALFATGFAPGGGPDEALQGISDFVITNDNPGIFLVQPSITTTGTLLFTPAADRTGLANVSVRVRDTGGSANGGTDLSSIKTFTITVTPAPDVTAPQPVLRPSDPVLRKERTFPVTIDFGEPVQSFALTDLTVGGGSASNLQPLGNGQFSFTFTAPADGNVTIGMAAGKVKDLANNNNLAAVPLALTIDSVGLTPVLSPTLPTITNNGSFVVNALFGERTFGLNPASITVLGGTVSNFNETNQATGQFTWTVTANGDGPITTLIPAGVSQDAFGNLNAASALLVRTVDRVAPAVTLSTSEPARTSRTTFDVFVDFSEPVSVFTLNQLTVSGATLANLRNPSSTRYIVEVRGSNGDVTVGLPAGVVQDNAGNGNTAAASLTRTIDNTAVVPDLTTSTISPTKNTTFPVRASFGREVTGFTLSDITVLNGDPSALNIINQTSGIYEFTVTAKENGDVTVILPSGIAQDLAGNPTSASSVLTVKFDSVSPRPTLSTPKSPILDSRTFDVFIDFAEPVVGLDINKILVTGGSKANFQPITTSRYVVTVTATADAPVTIELPANTVQDLAGNSSIAASPLTLQIDTLSPTPLITAPTIGAITRQNAWTINVDFGEQVFGFTQSDLSIVNGAITNFTPVNEALGRYSFTFAPANDGSVNVLLVPGVTQDAAGNSNRASNVFSTVVDRVAPKIELTSSEPSRTNRTTFEVIITPNEVLTGFDATDLRVTGGAVSRLDPLPNNRYAATILTSQPNVSIEIDASIATDSAGNVNVRSNTLSFVIDTIALVPNLSSATPAKVNQATVDVLVNFGKEVTDFTLSDVTVFGGTVNFSSTVNPNPGQYNLVLTATGEGVITALIPAGVVRDLAGNSNQVSNLLVRTLDQTAPRPQLSHNVSNLTNQRSIPISLQFGEAVNDFVASDIQVTGAAVINFQNPTPGNYSFVIQAATDGQVTVSIPGGVAKDDAQNANTASDTLQFTIDSSGRKPQLTTTAPTVSNSNSFVVSALFGERTFGFNASSITVLEGTVSDFTEVDQATGLYRWTVTTNREGPLTTLIAAGVSQDAFGNANTASDPLLRTVDRVAPSVSLSTNEPARTSRTSFDVFIDFSEPVSVLALDQLTVTGATLANLRHPSSTRYIVEVQGSNGNVTVGLPAGVVQDNAGNGNTAATPLTRTIDNTAIVPTLNTATVSPSKNASFIVRADFTREVSGFTIDDISVSNGSVSSFNELNRTSGLYEFTITAAGNGDVSVVLPRGIAQSLAGILSSESNVLKVTFDNIAPLPVLTTAKNPRVDSRTFDVVIDFGEAVQGFNANHVNVTGGTKSNFQTLTSSRYQITVTANSDGPVNMDIAAGVVQDLAGNANLAAAPLSLTVDTQAPRPTLVAVPNVGSMTRLGSWTMNVDFGEQVVGFTPSDLSLVNGSITGFTVSNEALGKYAFTLTPTNDGNVTVLIVPGIAQDVTGNSNLGSLAFNTLVDRVAPTIELTSSEPTRTNRATFEVIIISSETLTGFEIGDIRVTGGSVSRLDPLSNNRFSATIQSTQANVVVAVDAQVATDAAGNANAASNTLSFTVDTVALVPTITSAAPAHTNQSTFDVLVDFGKPVTDFTLSDVSVQGGTVAFSSTVNPTPGRFNLVFTATREGTVSAVIDAGAVRDLAGNLNQPSNVLSRVYDRSAPTSRLSSTVPSLTNLRTIPLTIEFGETIKDFTTADFVISGGAVTNLQPFGAGRYTFFIQAPTDGEVSISLPAAAVLDEAQNANQASNTLQFTIDTLGLTPVITPAVTNVTNVAKHSLTASFGAAVTGFELSDITIFNGSASNLQTVDASTGNFSFDVTATKDGLVTVLIPFGKTIDAFGNLNESSQSMSFSVDSSLPTALLTANVSGLTNLRSFPVQLEFSESVTGFELTDVTLSRGSASALQTLSPSRYSFLFTSDGDGPVTISLGAGKAQDAAGNGNTLSSTVQATIDATAPQPTLTSTLSNPVTTRDLTATVSFSEAVTGFTSADVFVVNGTLESLTPIDALKYELKVKATTDGVVVIGLVTGGAQDAAGNNSLGTAPLTLTVDQGAANYTPAINSNEPATTINRSFDATVDFGRTISGLTIDDFTLVNSAVTDLRETVPGSFRFKVTIANDGAYAITVGAGKVLDAQNRPNSASNTLSGVYVDFTNTDFGDAPTAALSGFSSSYPTRFSDNGARHKIGSLFLGSGVDAETDGQPSATAAGDEASGSASDGIEFLVTPIASSRAATFALLRVTASASGKLDGWIDLNRDGDWNDAGEQIVTSETVSAGNKLVFFTIPVGALPGTTYARFRLSSAGGLTPTGPAADGEVEDYRVSLLDGAAGANVRIDSESIKSASIEVSGSEVRVRQGSTEYFRSAVGDVTSIAVQSQGNTLLSVANPGSNLPGVIDYVMNGGKLDATLRVTQTSFDLDSPAGQALTGLDRIDLSAVATTLNITAAGVTRITEGAGPLRIITDGNDLLTKEAGWQYKTVVKESGRFVPTFENGAARIEVVTKPEWHNPFDALDVNGDGKLASLDALLVINALNGPRVMNSLGEFLSADQLDVLDYQFYDADGDGKLAPLDALLVINELNRRATGEPSEILWREEHRSAPSQEDEELIDEVMMGWGD